MRGPDRWSAGAAAIVADLALDAAGSGVPEAGDVSLFEGSLWILAKNGLASDYNELVLVGDRGRSPNDVFKVGTFHGCACAPRS